MAIIAKADAGGSIIQSARAHLAALEQPSLRRVLNATGVIVHTNLGRSPLSAAAREAVSRVAEGYSNLELELGSGVRGSRHAHVEALLCELTGAEAAIVVNNGAAAVLLAAAALAGPGRAIVVSRGQLVEIGGGFRIPEVIAQSGSEMVEVGTTNRTRSPDYERALAGLAAAGPVSGTWAAGAGTAGAQAAGAQAAGAEVEASANDRAQARVGAILRVHQSNFRTLGFVEEVSIEALCALGVPVIDDVGSGVLADAAGILALGDEPALRRSVAAGAALVCCSGDKLLGGPQAGLIIGRRHAVTAARRHPLARALRIDKLSLAALEATLMLYRDPQRARREIPVLAMLDATEAELAAGARRMQVAIGPTAEVIRATAKIGGGALPLVELAGPAVALSAREDPVALARALRVGDPPVIARIHDGRVVLDPRTLHEDDLESAAAAVLQALVQG